jgi:hypothetical protein
VTGFLEVILSSAVSSYIMRPTTGTGAKLRNATSGVVDTSATPSNPRNSSVFAPPCRDYASGMRPTTRCAAPFALDHD